MQNREKGLLTNNTDMTNKFSEIIKSKFPGKISVTFKIILLIVLLVLVSRASASPSDENPVATVPGSDPVTVEAGSSYTYSLPDNTPISSGGGSSSRENVSNIKLIERSDLPIYRNVTTFYRFTHVKNPVMFVNITGNTTMDIITTLTEVLNGTSTLVKTPPKGLVYKNINIRVGTPGFATSRNIKEALIKFRVENSWMSANNVTSSDIVLVKWNGNSWIELETNVLSKDDTDTFFEGKTITFSPFAIIAKISEARPIANADSNVNTSANSNVNTNANPNANISPLKTPQQPGASQKPVETAVITRIETSLVSTWSIILIILIMNFIVIALYFLWVRK
ncbi:PGF-pre-PGF domain-containing protein [Candidatus Methanoperedens sp. BLZ2]|uniref:PGF-pre-PGF domain-containing protein n=1 Tax=Candidatus Methanoperedens sp. BLZ2 TaxID=2035255 RepID=UPI001C3EAE57|nr:PGF-pre-PGF domain-containing protein [Candidatus Methanoperedens sp. BLZ2]MBZ0176940.1 PGF-pre-PGF domain-containing protein [Candidatus Methanoperedens nitroreducens]